MGARRFLPSTMAQDTSATGTTTNRGAPEGPARAIGDLRFWVAAESEPEVWALVAEFRRRAEAVAPPGLSVRWTELGGGRSSDHKFEPTMGRRRQ